MVRIGADPNGKTREIITEILSVDKTTASPSRDKLPPLVVTRVEYGKLSARTRGGFGFMASDTGGSDVYLSPKRFLDPGMEDVEIGDPIEADVAIGMGGTPDRNCRAEIVTMREKPVTVRPLPIATIMHDLADFLHKEPPDPEVLVGTLSRASSDQISRRLTASGPF
jgi:cold shock CspA family protein